MNKPMFDQTVEVDNIRCPWCGELFDGQSATNNNQDKRRVECPYCEGNIEIFQSVEYLSFPRDE